MYYSVFTSYWMNPVGTCMKHWASYTLLTLQYTDALTYRGLSSIRPSWGVCFRPIWTEHYSD